jgi:hypothetical protein
MDPKKAIHAQVKNAPQGAGGADSPSKPKDGWDKADVVGKIVGSLFIPLVVLLASYSINVALQKRADQLKTIEIAITILQSDKADNSPLLKDWALGVLQSTAKSASQTIPAPVIEELKKTPLPSNAGTKGQFPIVGLRFTPEEFEKYVSKLEFPEWRPSFIVIHNTGSPNLDDWRSIPGETRMRNLANFYATVQGLSGGPHLIVDDKGIWVFNPLDKPGVHSPSWNHVSIGVEMVGDYTREKVDPAVLNNTVRAVAILDAAFKIQANTLKFHSDDPKTTHVCPGPNLHKEDLIPRIAALLECHSRQQGCSPERSPARTE